MSKEREYCNVCNKECKTKEFYDGWNSICSKECLEKWIKDNYDY